MSTKTTNLGLDKPQMSDTLGTTIPQLANNFDVIDSNISSNTTQLAQKATLTEVQGRGFNVLFPPAPLVAPIGDGVADDTANLQAIFNYAYASGYKLTFPNKTFRITSTLYIKDTIVIEGYKGALDKAASYIQLDTTSDIPAIIFGKDDSSQLYDVYMSDIAVYRKGLVTNTYNTLATGIRMVNVSESRFDNISVSGFKIGLELRLTTITDFIKLKSYYNQYGIWLGDNDINQVAYGTNGMNNFYFGNLFKNNVNVVLGGNLNHFVGCHMESASDSCFYIDNAYMLQVYNTTIRNCNIRQYATDTRFIKINPSVGANTLYIFNFQVEDTFVALTNSTCAIEQLVNGAGSRQTKIKVSDSQFWGVTTAAVNSSYAMTVNFDGSIRVRTNFDGSGSDMPLTAGSVIPIGNTKDAYRNNMLGTVNFSANSAGITNVAGDVSYNAGYHTLQMHDGTSFHYIPVLYTGTASQRPSSGNYVGLQYVDTTLNKTITYYGSNVWRDQTSRQVWNPSFPFSVNAIINTDVNQYQCTTAGTTGTTMPTHTSGTATDGTVVWTFVKTIA